MGFQWWSLIGMLAATAFIYGQFSTWSVPIDDLALPDFCAMLRGTSLAAAAAGQSVCLAAGCACVADRNGPRLRVPSCSIAEDGPALGGRCNSIDPQWEPADVPVFAMANQYEVPAHFLPSPLP